MKKLLVLSACLLCGSVLAQLPALTRGPWTTNVIPINGTAYGTTNLSVSFGTNISEQIYNVKEAFGAKCDRKQAVAAITSNSTAIVASTSVFSAADVGKVIVLVNGGLTNNASRYHYDFATTIVGFTNATTVGLTAAPSNTIAATRIIWGTDDRTAVQAALNAAATNLYDTTVFIPPPGSMIGTGLTDAGINTNHHNAALVLPPITTFYRAPTITIRGANKAAGNYSDPGMLGSGFTWALVRSPGEARTNAARFFSMNNGWTVPSIVVPTWYAGIQYCRIVLRDFSFEHCFDNNCIGFDLYSALQVNVHDIAFTCTHGTADSPSPAPQGTNGISLIMPFEGAFNEHSLRDCSFSASYYGASIVGLLSAEGNTFYNVARAYTLRNTPTSVHFSHDCFMNCSNAFFVPALGTIIGTVESPSQINDASQPGWATWGVNNWFLFSDDGGAQLTIQDYQYFTPTGQTNIPPICNGVSGALNKRIAFNTKPGDLPGFIGGRYVHIDDLSTSRLLYGDPTTFRLDSTSVDGTGAAGYFGQPNAVRAEVMWTSNAFSRVWTASIFPTAYWTNRNFENYTVYICMTNAGIVQVDLLYDVWSGTNRITERSQTGILVTNTVDRMSILPVTWQDNYTIPANVTMIQPFLFWPGQFASFGMTNHAAYISGKLSFSSSGTQAY